MSDLRADIDQLRSTAPKFAAIGQDLQHALDQLTAGLDAEGRHCWGDDEPGKQFEKGYHDDEKPGGVKDGIKGIKSLITTLQDGDKRILADAEALEAQDAANANSFRTI